MVGPLQRPLELALPSPLMKWINRQFSQLVPKGWSTNVQLPFRTLVDQYLANYEDADFVAA